MGTVNLNNEYTLIYSNNGRLSEVRKWVADRRSPAPICVIWLEGGTEEGTIAPGYTPDVYPLAAEYFAYIESLPPSQQPPFYRADMNNNPPPQPVWGGFRMAMLQNPAYRSLTQMADVLKVQRLENAISMSADEIFLPAVIMLWNEMVAGLLLPDGAIEQWQSIASATFVPLRWNEDGTLEPTL